MVNNKFESTEDMNNILQTLWGKTQLKLYQKISN